MHTLFDTDSTGRPFTHDDETADASDAAAWLSQRLAEDTAPALRWTLPHLETVEHAATHGIHADGTGTYRRTPTGRRIAAERVKALTAGGFLTEADGIVTATPDGVEAARRLRAVPDALMTAEDYRAHAHRVYRARAHGKRAELLPCLPEGEEDKRRKAAERAQFEESVRECARARARFAAQQAKWEAADEAERAVQAAREAADEAERADRAMYGCGSCPAYWELDARCGACRSAIAPAPHVPETVEDDGWAEEYAEQATYDAAQAPTRRPAVRAEITRHHHTGSQSQARITLPASRAHRARDHRAIVLETARILGIQTSTPRRLLADGTHTGAELWRHVDITGPARAVDRMVTTILPVMNALERLATRAARRYGSWRRSLLTLLSGLLDDYTPTEVRTLGRQYRSDVLSHLTASMAQGPRPVRDDARRPLWERAEAVAAELWIQDPIDPWTTAAEPAGIESAAPEPAAVESAAPPAPHGPIPTWARRARRPRTGARRQATTRPATTRAPDAARPATRTRVTSTATRTHRAH